MPAGRRFVHVTKTVYESSQYTQLQSPHERHHLEERGKTGKKNDFTVSLLSYRVLLKQSYTDVLLA